MRGGIRQDRVFQGPDSTGADVLQPTLLHGGSELLPVGESPITCVSDRAVSTRVDVEQVVELCVPRPGRLTISAITGPVPTFRRLPTVSDGTAE